MTRSADLEQRLAYLDLSPSDLELLRDLRPTLEEQAPPLIAAFYHHLLSFPRTRQLLKDPAVRERLLDAQRQYLLSLAGPTLDDAFAEQRRHIGETHERIGLEPRWYLGAYALYLALLIPVVHEANHDPHRAAATIGALQKLIFLDSQLAMEAYIDRRERELHDLTDELSKERRRLARDYEDQKLELRLTENRARVAEELASVGTLVAGLAHEIGTPMGVIQGHANLLESEVHSDDAKWRLRTIQEQVGRISKIIQTLLNMARPGKARHVPVALEPLIESTLSFLQEKFSRRGIDTEAITDVVPDVVGDPERLQQLFLNLFLNAADAMPKGGKLRIALAVVDDQIEVRVADDGAGIAPRDLERIFDPFFTSKEAGTGNGLGLMVAKGIVTDHGGDIDVTSREGRGTEFTLRFPAPNGEETTAES